MNETNSNWLTANPCIVTSTGTSTINGNCGTTISGNSTGLAYSTGLTYSNINNMRTKQVKAAVFTIERNDKNEVVSSKFVKELWVEIKNGASLDLVVAKELKGDFDPETTVVREIYSLSF